MCNIVCNLLGGHAAPVVDVAQLGHEMKDTRWAELEAEEAAAEQAAANSTGDGPAKLFIRTTTWNLELYGTDCICVIETYLCTKPY